MIVRKVQMFRGEYQRYLLLLKWGDKAEVRAQGRLVPERKPPSF